MYEGAKVIHAISGLLIFIVGFIQIALPKGGSGHRLLGQLYVLAWIKLVPTGAIIGNWLITCLGIFGLYMVMTGWRLAVEKKVKMEGLDKFFVASGAITVIALFAFSISTALAGNITFGTIGVFFGVLFGMTVNSDYKRVFKKERVSGLSFHRMEWYFEHLQRMYISYIAAMTAFAALQQIFPIVILNWILPTVLGSILIYLSKRHYLKKFNIKSA